MADSPPLFLGEGADYPREDCSDFVRNVVVPFMERLDGAGIDRAALRRRLPTWFDARPEPTKTVYDFDADWCLLLDALDVLHHDALPLNLEGKLILGNSIISDPVFENAFNRTYAVDWPPLNALADARALRNGYKAWKVPMDLAWVSR